MNKLHPNIRMYSKKEYDWRVYSNFFIFTSNSMNKLVDRFNVKKEKIVIKPKITNYIIQMWRNSVIKIILLRI